MQGIKDLQLYVQVLMITSNIHSNCKFLFCRVLHVQHAFLSFTPANKFLVRDVFVVFPLLILKLALLLFASSVLAL